MASSSRLVAAGDAAPQSTAAPLVRLRDVRVAYDSRLALDGVTLDLPAGQLVSVIGPNGSGKSTLLKAIVGLVPLAAGTVELNVAEARDRGLGVASVPQPEAVRWGFKGGGQVGG